MDGRSAVSTREEPLVVGRALATARDHELAGRTGEAELLYRQVLGAAPATVDALLGLAVLHHGRGEHLEAELLLETAVETAPHDDRLGSALADVRGALDGSQKRTFAERVRGRLRRPLLPAIFQKPRVWKYRALSNCPNVSGRPIRNQPVLFLGRGEVVVGEGVEFGWRASPLFYTGYCHVEAALVSSRIEFGDRVEINNNAMLKSEGPGIRIGRDGLFGAHVEVFDSDFHELHPARRRRGRPKMAPVEIGDNVFVGMSVKILKGVTIGADSVIGAGAVVTSSVPAGVIAAGNPATVVREL